MMNQENSENFALESVFQVTSGPSVGAYAAQSSQSVPVLVPETSQSTPAPRVRGRPSTPVSTVRQRPPASSSSASTSSPVFFSMPGVDNGCKKKDEPTAEVTSPGMGSQ